MGKTNGRYNAEFPVGMTVKIATENELINFRESWRLHHPLSTEQIRFAGSKVKVVEVSYYHGGDELYSLEDVPGLWHECCLSAEAESSDTYPAAASDA